MLLSCFLFLLRTLLLPQFIIILLFQGNFLPQREEADLETIHTGLMFFVINKSYALGI
jgi:hypothetical protein